MASDHLTLPTSYVNDKVVCNAPTQIARRHKLLVGDHRRNDLLEIHFVGVTDEEGGGMKRLLG